MNVFFCRFGLKTRLVRRKEKLTLWPNCFPLPVSSQRAVISLVHFLLVNIQSVLVYAGFGVTSRADTIVSMDILYLLLVLLAIFVSMTLHELMHGLVANRLGDDTARLMGRLTLNPVKHVDPIMTIALPLIIITTNALTGSAMPIFGGAKPVPFNPSRIKYDEWGVALMAISGPLTNLFLALIAYVALALSPLSSDSLAGQLLTVMTVVNLGFFAFNILPLPPLDGSRVLYVIAPDSVRNLLETAERYGLFLLYIVILIASPLLFMYMRIVTMGCLQVFAQIVGGIT